MLKEEVYLDKIADFMAWYVNFQFRIYDVDEKTKEKKQSLQYQVWYKAFQNFSDSDFIAICDGYMRENVYPPSSPTSLLDYAKKVLVNKNKENIDKVWQELKDLIAYNGFSSYKQWSPIDNDYVYFSPLKEAIKNHGDKKLEKVFDIMYSRLQTLSQYTENKVREDFFKEYERLITEEIGSSVNQGKLDLGNGDKKQIENKGE